MARIKVRTPKQLRAIARGQVSTEISGEVAPKLEEQRYVTRRRASTLKDLGTLYGGLQPYVTQSAQRVAGYAQQEQAAEREVFARYASQLNQLQQQQATEAQQLAQQMGGPVPVGEFQAGTRSAAASQPALAAGAMLQSAGLGTADVQAAEQFAGQVFPAMQREDTSAAISAFEEKEYEIQKEIGRIRGTRGGRETTALNKLMEGERTYQLQTLQQDLERLKANRDWKLAQASLKQAGVELDLKDRELDEIERSHKAAEAEARAARGATTALEWAKLSEAQRQARISNALEKQKVSMAKRANSDSTRAGELIDLALNGGSKPVTTITPQPVGEFQVGAPGIPSGAYISKRATRKGKPYSVGGRPVFEYVLPVKRTETITSGGAIDPATDPIASTRVYRFLLQHGIPEKMARNRVIQAMNLPKNWKPKPLGYGPPEKAGPPKPGEAGPGPFPERATGR